MTTFLSAIILFLSAVLGYKFGELESAKQILREKNKQILLLRRRIHLIEMISI